MADSIRSTGSVWWLYLHWLRILPSWLLIAFIALLLASTIASGWLFLRSVGRLEENTTIVSNLVTEDIPGL